MEGRIKKRIELKLRCNGYKIRKKHVYRIYQLALNRAHEVYWGEAIHYIDEAFDKWKEEQFHSKLEKLL